LNNYLIPANSKKSMLILSVFTMSDLIMFGTGCIITMALLFIIKSNNIWVMVFDILPALITGCLVMPIPNYHNVLGFLTSLMEYYFNRRQYVWKGWCVKSVYGRDFERK
jgi:hypothetical protein